MVLSRTTLVVLLVGMVLALGIGLLGAVSSASPKDNDGGHNNGDQGHNNTLTVLTKNRQIEVVDLGPKGPSQGDIRAVNAPLYNETGKKKVGRFDQFGVVTDPADEANEKVNMVQRTFTYTLPGGEISAQGQASYNEFDRPSPKGVDAITGGTGTYAGVRGEVRYETRGDKVINTFHFID